MENTEKNDFEIYESIFDSDDYTMEQIYRNELIKLSKKSINLMSVADDLIKANPKFTRVGMENQKLNKENQLLAGKIHFLEDRERYLQNQNEQLNNELDKLTLLQSDSEDSCLLNVFKKSHNSHEDD